MRPRANRAPIMVSFARCLTVVGNPDRGLSPLLRAKGLVILGEAEKGLPFGREDHRHERKPD